MSNLLFFLFIHLPGDFAHLTDLWNLWWTLSNSIPSRHWNWYSSSLWSHRLGQLHIQSRQWMLRYPLCFLLLVKRSQLLTLNITSCRRLWLSLLTLESTNIDWQLLKLNIALYLLHFSKFLHINLILNQSPRNLLLLLFLLFLLLMLFLFLSFFFFFGALFGYFHFISFPYFNLIIYFLVKGLFSNSLELFNLFFALLPFIIFFLLYQTFFDFVVV